MVTYYSVYETSTGDLLKAGYSSFVGDGWFNAGLHTERTDGPIPGQTRDSHEYVQMHRWNGSAWVLVAKPAAVFDPGPFDDISPLTTKGDIITYDSSTVVRLPVGNDDEVLTADSAQAEGIKWAPAPSSGHTIQEETVSVAQRTNLDFKAGFDVVDNAGSDATEVSLDLSEISVATYGHLAQANGAGFIIDIVSPSVYVKWTGSQSKLEGGDMTVSLTTHDVTVGTGGAGVYEIEYSVTMQAPSNDDVSAAIFINDTILQKTESFYDVNNTSSVNTLSYSCLMSLNDGDVVDLRIANDVTNDVTVFNVCVNLTKQGGATGPQGEPGPGSTLEVLDEGVSLSTAALKLNFKGAGVEVTEPSPDCMDVTIALNDENIDGGNADTVYTVLDVDGGGA